MGRQKDDIFERKGMASCLAKAMAQTYGTNEQNMEVGASIITNTGVFTHIVQGIDANDLESSTLTPIEYISHQLIVKKSDVANVFVSHFGLDPTLSHCKFFSDPSRNSEMGSMDAASLRVRTSNFLTQCDLESKSTLDSVVEILRRASANKASNPRFG